MDLFNKLKDLVIDLSLCDEHLEGCRADKYLVEADFHCDCYDWDYYNYESLKERAKELVKEMETKDKEYRWVTKLSNNKGWGLETASEWGNDKVTRFLEWQKTLPIEEDTVIDYLRTEEREKQ